MTTLALRLGSGLGSAWNYLRAVMGDQAYERYLEVARRDGVKPLSAEEFYVESLERRYSTVSRCC